MRDAIPIIDIQAHWHCADMISEQLIIGFLAPLIDNHVQTLHALTQLRIIFWQLLAQCMISRPLLLFGRFLNSGGFCQLSEKVDNYSEALEQRNLL